jgi:hypothetical protein
LWISMHAQGFEVVLLIQQSREQGLDWPRLFSQSLTKWAGGSAIGCVK